MNKFNGYWLAVTADRYELPLIVADSAEELASILGVKTQTIQTVAWRNERDKYKMSGRNKGYRIKRTRMIRDEGEYNNGNDNLGNL